MWLLARPNLRRYDYSLQAIRVARQLGADLIYTRLTQVAAISSQLGLNTMLETHDLPQGRVGPWLFRLFLQGRGARRLVVITKALADDLIKAYGATHAKQPRDKESSLASILVITPDGVDLRRYANLPSPDEARQYTKPPLPDRFTAGYTGHMYTGRGLELIFSLAIEMPEMDFLLVGGEPDEISSYRARAHNLDINNIILTGFIPNADLPNYQAACDVLLMPYQHSVAASSGGNIARYLSPMKAFEYLACERPILSSDLPVLQEILNSNNSVLLPPDNVLAWSTALRELKSDPQRRATLASQARRDADSYTWEGRARRILEGMNA
jgi:glycosyltransferase involved in cell wall biosynthesis